MTAVPTTLSAAISHALRSAVQREELTYEQVIRLAELARHVNEEIISFLADQDAIAEERIYVTVQLLRASGNGVRFTYAQPPSSILPRKKTGSGSLISSEGDRGLKAIHRHARCAAVQVGMLMAALLALPSTTAAQAKRYGVACMAYKRAFSSRLSVRGKPRSTVRAQGARSGVRPLLNYGGADAEALSGAHGGLSAPRVGSVHNIRR